METTIYVGLDGDYYGGPLRQPPLSSSIVKEDPKFSVLENPLLRDTIIFGGLSTLVSCSGVLLRLYGAWGPTVDAGNMYGNPFLGALVWMEAVKWESEVVQNMGISQNSGYLFGGPHNKDYNMSGSILGSPYFGELPCLPSTIRLRDCTIPRKPLGSWRAPLPHLPPQTS